MLKYVKAAVSYIYEKSFRGTMFQMDLAQRQEVLQSFPEPKDDIERSFFQYQCHMRSVSRLLRFVQSAVSYPVFLALMLGSFRKPAPVTAVNTAAYISYGIGEEIIPRSLQARFDRIIRVDDSPLLFTRREQKWFLPIWKRYWKYPYFLLKCYTKAGMYAAIQQQCQAKAFLVYSEFSFTCSLLTDYCRQLGAEHINLLHGEKLLNIRDSFVRYHRFYVWDESYRDLFLQMRAEPSQFKVETPPMLHLDLPQIPDKAYDLTYYASGLPSDQAQDLAQRLNALLRQGKRICVRLHPRFGNHKLIKEQLHGVFFEDPSEVSLEDSLANTHACCGLSTTVLYQAYLCNKEIVIDDISNPEKFLLMQNLGYRMLQIPHSLLSRWN